MKNIKTILAVFSLVFLLVSCAGTHGKIEWFPFKAPQGSIRLIIDEIVKTDSLHFVPSDRSDYWDIYIKNSNPYKIFTYRFYGDSTIFWNDYPNQSCIALIYVKEGQVFKKEDDLGYLEKKIVINLFNKHFINLIRQQYRPGSGLKNSR